MRGANFIPGIRKVIRNEKLKSTFPLAGFLIKENCQGKFSFSQKFQRKLQQYSLD
jgi:hypothetical protein